MAYLNYLASVDWPEIEELRAGLRGSVTAKSVATVSHVLPGAVKERTLRACLTGIIDKGEVLHPIFWHPLRVPLLHPPEAVCSLNAELRAVLSGLDARGEIGFSSDFEIMSVVGVLDEASKNKRGIVSVLGPPTDEERAKRVACPFNEPEKLPRPWENRIARQGRASS